MSDEPKRDFDIATVAPRSDGLVARVLRSAGGIVGLYALLIVTPFAVKYGVRHYRAYQAELAWKSPPPGGCGAVWERSHQWESPRFTSLDPAIPQAFRGPNHLACEGSIWCAELLRRDLTDPPDATIRASNGKEFFAVLREELRAFNTPSIMDAADLRVLLQATTDQVHLDYEVWIPSARSCRVSGVLDRLEATWPIVSSTKTTPEDWAVNLVPFGKQGLRDAIRRGLRGDAKRP